MIPSKIKIESFAKRCHLDTLGGKGLRILSLLKVAWGIIFSLIFPPEDEIIYYFES